MAVKDYIDTNDFTKEELLDMIELAQSMKAMIKEGGRYPLIPNGYGSIFFPTWSGRCNPTGCGSTKSTITTTSSNRGFTRPDQGPRADRARSSCAATRAISARCFSSIPN